MKRISALFVAILLLVSLTPAQALQDIQPFASNYLDSYSITVSPQGSGVLMVDATVTAVHPKMTKIGFPTIALYELNGDSWTLVKTVSSQYTENAGSYRHQFTYQGTAGKSYYAGASFIAQDSTGSDMRSVNSTTKKAT